MSHINYTFIFVYQKKNHLLKKKITYTIYIKSSKGDREQSVWITSWVFQDPIDKGQKRVHNQGWSIQSMTSWVTFIQRVSLQSRVSVQSLTSWVFPKIPQGHVSLHSDTQR